MERRSQAIQEGKQGQPLSDTQPPLSWPSCSHGLVFDIEHDLYIQVGGKLLPFRESDGDFCVKGGRH